MKDPKLLEEVSYGRLELRILKLYNADQFSIRIPIQQDLSPIGDVLWRVQDWKGRIIGTGTFRCNLNEVTKGGGLLAALKAFYEKPLRPFSIDDIRNLRDETGAGLGDCKLALIESGGDFEAAKWALMQDSKVIVRSDEST